MKTIDFFVDPDQIHEDVIIGEVGIFFDEFLLFFVGPDQIHEDVGPGQVIVGAVGEHPGVPVGVPHEAHLQDDRPGNLHRYRKKSVLQN